MKDFSGKTAVITGAGSGFGREFARFGAALGMRLVLADIQQDALDAVAAELREGGAEVLALRTDVSKAADMEALAAAAFEKFGRVHLLFNNAGVGAGGFIWENSVADWEWVLGVNVWSIIHGVRLFVPKMLEQGDECHVVNTASVAGLLSAQLMGVYNVSKHAVVTFSETLYQDLLVAKANIGVTVLCPAFVPTGIANSERNRPVELGAGELTASQKIAAQATVKAVSSGRMTAEDVAAKVFDCIREKKFYCITHPKILGSVELRLQDIVGQRNPSDPFSYKPAAAPAVVA
jgi:NAD(P)-dependent dehydrogenase (short-subunit alcohol dehydrogenase family)